MSSLYRRKLRPILKGMKTVLPGAMKPGTTRGTNSARYCYAVWLRHLTLAKAHGLEAIPACVAELGPGDSLGIGLAALLSGAQSYRALDIVQYASPQGNLAVFDELVELFSARAAIPDEAEFPRIHPPLPSYLFPHACFDRGALEEALSPQRIAALREDILHATDLTRTAAAVAYHCPWNDEAVIAEQSVDFVFSQAVLEHVNDVPATYRALHRWLKKGGLMSNVIDFASHGIVPDWNGHWAFSDVEWKLVKGARPYLLNRWTLSQHLEQMDQQGFQVISVLDASDHDGLRPHHLARRFRALPPSDHHTRSAFVLARKR